MLAKALETRTKERRHVMKRKWDSKTRGWGEMVSGRVLPPPRGFGQDGNRGGELGKDRGKGGFKQKVESR